MEDKLKENFHRVEWLTEYENNVNYMLCPSQSPDLQPNEDLDDVFDSTHHHT